MPHRLYSLILSISLRFRFSPLFTPCLSNFFPFLHLHHNFIYFFHRWFFFSSFLCVLRFIIMFTHFRRLNCDLDWILNGVCFFPSLPCIQCMWHFSRSNSFKRNEMKHTFQLVVCCFFVFFFFAFIQSSQCFSHFPSVHDFFQ